MYLLKGVWGLRSWLWDSCRWGREGTAKRPALKQVFCTVRWLAFQLWYLYLRSREQAPLSSPWWGWRWGVVRGKGEFIFGNLGFLEWLDMLVLLPWHFRGVTCFIFHLNVTRGLPDSRDASLQAPNSYKNNRKHGREVHPLWLLWPHRKLALKLGPWPAACQTGSVSIPDCGLCLWFPGDIVLLTVPHLVIMTSVGLLIFDAICIFWKEVIPF